ncbi:MAG TPA: hypothetical protein DDZ89_09350 [Clostridiales bacterium]|nr:hypothetical protein [Clostridiales bacterium]
MEKKNVSTFKIAATYIGTIVGAGFATGQEILQFFARFGKPGLIGLALATVFFVYFGYVIMYLGKQGNAESHLEVIRYSEKRLITGLTDVLITFFLFGAFAAMIAGTGALFQQQFHVDEIAGNIIMAVLTALTVLIGFDAVINSISFVVPFLLLSVIGISIFSIISTPPDFSEIVVSANQGGLVNRWLPAALLYVSYNTVISISVLGPLGVKAQNRKMIIMGSILGGLGLGVGSLFIFLALSANLLDVAGLEVPMTFIAGKIQPSVQIIYSVILIAEIYTTAVGSLYGFVARVNKNDKKKVKTKVITILVTIGAFLAGQLGFSNLVKYLYPLVGYGGLLMLISLVIAMRKVEKPKPNR